MHSQTLAQYSYYKLSKSQVGVSTFKPFKIRVMKKVLVLIAVFTSVAALTLNAQDVKKEQSKEKAKTEQCEQKKECCEGKKEDCKDKKSCCTEKKEACKDKSAAKKEKQEVKKEDKKKD